MLAALLLVAASAQPQENAAEMFKSAEDELQHFDQTDLRALQQEVQPRPQSLLQKGEEEDDLGDDEPVNLENFITKMKGLRAKTDQEWSGQEKKTMNRLKNVLDDVHHSEKQNYNVLRHSVFDQKKLDKTLKHSLAMMQKHAKERVEREHTERKKWGEAIHRLHRKYPNLAHLRADPSSFVEESAQAGVGSSLAALAAAEGKEFASSSETQREVQQETANALKDAALKDAEEESTKVVSGAARPHSQRVEVKDFKEEMEATMSAQKKKLSSFLENMKNQFHMKLDRDANETHMAIKKMQIQDAKDLKKLEEKQGLGTSLLEGSKYPKHAMIDPEVLKQNDEDMARSRARVAAIQHKLEKEEARMRAAAQQLSQTNSPDYGADSLSLAVLNH